MPFSLNPLDELAALQASDPMLGMAPSIPSPSDVQAQEAATAYAQELANGSTEPTPAATLPQPPGLPSVLPPGLNPGASRGQSQSYSMGGSSLNQQTLSDLQTGTAAKGYKGDVARANKGRLKQAEALNANLDPAFAAQEAAATQSAQVAGDIAADKAGDPEAAKAAVNQAAGTLGLAPVTTTGAAQRAIAQASVIAKEQEEGAKAQIRAEQARAQYTEALNRVKSSVINPNRLVANQSLAFGLQNAVASIAAISGKPGMTNFANMLNQGMLSAMSRDVDAQMAKLEQNKSVAAGFKQIYDMVSDENDTQQQRRDKVYGAYLASMEGYLESQMGQHDSEVINAQLQQTLAGIKTKRAEVENKNYSDALELGLKDAQLITSKYATDVNASVQRAQIAEARAHRMAQANAAAQERADKQRAALAESTIASPFRSDDHRIVGVAKDEFKGDIAKLSAAVTKSLDMSNDLRELAIEIEKRKQVGDTAGVAALMSDFGRRFDVVKEELAFAVAQARQPGDPRVTDADRTAAAKSISADPKQWVLGAGAGGAMDQVERSVRQSWDAAASQMMKSPDLYNETEASYLSPRVVQHEFSDTGKAVFGAQGAQGVVEPVRKGYAPEDKAGKAERSLENAKWDGLMNPRPDTPAEDLYKDAFDVTNNKSVALDYDKAPDWYKQYVQSDEGKFLGRYESDTKQGDKVYVPEFTQSMYNLAYKAQAGDHDAFTQLNKIAGTKDKKFKEQSDMATWMLDSMAEVNFGIQGTDSLVRYVGADMDKADQSVIDAAENTKRANAVVDKFMSGHGGLK